jgi:DEAD/DEAH box helicase domain-containing protein
MDALGLFERYASQPQLRERIANVVTVPGKPAVFGELESTLHPKLLDALGKQGLTSLFAHQAAAIDSALAGRDTIVITGTGSGKTLCYNAPALHTCLSEPMATALYLFPTKALSQDQAGKLEAIAGDVRIGVYDGDTPRQQRTAIRKGAHIVLTNPDMLHVGILPRHEEWSRFLKSLRFIVVDEAHTYRGVFGSHVGNVLRRLLRLCAWYRSQPVVIACSATVGNPNELFTKLTGKEATLVKNDGAPRSERNIVLVEPPPLEEDEGFSPNMETARLLAEFVSNGVRTLAFCRARVSTELVVRYARKALDAADQDVELVESYRGGYTPDERRDIEQRLFKGTLTGLATTNAMELGVDVGGLDAIVMNGYPGTLASFWQQAGRAGRGADKGFAAMIAHEDPMEQYLARNPGVLLKASESVALSPENPYVLGAQLRCAAYERPISEEELALFGAAAAQTADALQDEGMLRFSAGRWFYPSHEPPAAKVDIRGIGGQGVTLYSDGVRIGEMERWRALQSAHEGAVYLHRTKTYVVEKLDLARNEAHMREYEPGYFTQAVVMSVVEPTVELQSQRQTILSGMSVTSAVVGYRKMAQDGRQVLGEHALELPTQSYDTVGIKFALGPDWSPTDNQDAIGAIHGMEHALMAVAPVLAACDRRDLGSAWFSIDPADLEPSVYVFDAMPGGMGLCEALFAQRLLWLETARDLVESCRCEGGCPACLYSANCEAMNEHLSKLGALKVLESVIHS